MFVYWLHLSEHIDIFSDGYIGVSDNPSKRLKGHKYTDNPHLANAFKKYENVVQTVLLEGSDEYCLSIENKLRPMASIGWNIVAGGGRPPSHLGIAKSENHKRKIGQSKIGKPRSPEMVQFLSESRQGQNNPNYGRKHTPEALAKMRANSGRKGKAPWNKKAVL